MNSPLILALVIFGLTIVISFVVAGIIKIMHLLMHINKKKVRKI